MGFNYTALDVDKSRSFGLVTKKRELVKEAIKLFEADSLRQPYTPGPKAFVVSPVTARARLAAFLRGARKQLLVYDPELTDPTMIRILHERVSAGVSVRILGKLGKRGAGLTAEKFPGRRLHVRAIIRDGRQAFVGSQGLRKLELDGRREVGLIVKHPKVVARMAAIFEADWSDTDRVKQDVKDARKDEKAEARVEAEAKAEAKQEARVEAKVEATIEAEAKAEARHEAKTEAKVEVESKAEAKQEAKQEAKAEKAEAKVQKAEAKSEAKAEAKAEKAEAKVEKAEAKSEARAEAKAEKAEAKVEKAEAKAGE